MTRRSPAPTITPPVPPGAGASGAAGRAGRWVAGLTAGLLVAGALGGCGGRATTHHKPGTSHQEASGPAGTLLAAQDGQGHRLRQVGADGAPEVQLSVRPDTEDGWNLQLTVRNFRFTPDSTGGGAVLGGGHAHLLLDGRKLARLYGPWHHLSAAQVPAGGHTLTVRLYADDHTAWAVAGKPVESSTTLTATGAGAGHGHAPAPGGGPSTPAGPRTTPVDRTVTVAVRDGKVEPPPGRTELERGRRVALTVTSDTADTLHVHGYDKELALPAGRPATLVLTVDRAGLFEVETHDTGLVLTQLLVR
ncbi:hypothetical protein ACIQUQ_18205 [Streptomyces sp. NPDC101118]|uniref:hypothetical protein n=1 Tax=Streptomyces sp. NPDC101118 TaxID=3366109 RepID=UPI0038191A8D